MNPRAASLLTTLSVTLVVASAASAMASSATVLDMPFARTNGWIIVPLTINGSPPLRCILDTGMPSGGFVFDPAVGEKLGLNYAGRANVASAGATKTKPASIATAATLGLGGLEFDQQRVIVLDERHEIANLGVDAIVGETVFRDYVVQIDYDAKRLTLYAQEGFSTDGLGSPIPLTLERGTPFVSAAVALGSQSQVEVKLLVDTGMSGGLTLELPPASRRQLPQKRIRGVVGSGIEGPMIGERGRIAGLTLGDHTIPRIIAAFPDLTSSTANDPHGALGAGVLELFTATFDYARGQLFLQPAAGFSRPFEFNMAGFTLRPLEDGALRVDDIIEGSPGAQAQVRVGDRIVAVDGLLVAEADQSVVRERFRQPGKRLQLHIERDGRLVDTTVKLKRLI